MELVADIISAILLAVGSAAVLVGALGLVRFPNIFTRLHAAGVVDTLGAFAILAALIIQAGFTLISFKLLVIGALLFFTTPVASHAVVRAALYGGQQPMAKRMDEAELSRSSGAEGGAKSASGQEA